MSVIHIPEEEALQNFAAVLHKVDAGDDVVIDRPTTPVRVSAAPFVARTGAEMLEILERLPERGSVDEDFAHDVQSFRDRHPESLDGSKWD